MIVQDTAVLAVAGRLSAQAGLPAPRVIEPLSGGKNNRVLRVDDRTVLKLYHRDPRDPRDRLRAEWRFLCYARARGVRNVPQPLACDDAAGAALYTLLPGAAPNSGAITAHHVDAALALLLAVNAEPRDVSALDPGSEACFTLDEHIATIDRRVARLHTIDPDVPHAAEAAALIAGRLDPLWRTVRAGVYAGAGQLGISPDAPLDDRSMVISPSDFGFHNALVDGGRISFVDFEYAGRDDPAKLVCDFFCQPEVPVPLAYMPDFTHRLVAGLDLAPHHTAGCALLLDAYRVKWACIILNDFLPLGSARRAFAALARTAERCARQIARAAAKLDEIDHEG